MHHGRDAKLPGVHHTSLQLSKALRTDLRLHRSSPVRPGELAEAVLDQFLPVKGGGGEIVLVRSHLARRIGPEPQAAQLRNLFP